MPMLKRKPAMAVMVAVGKPKMGPPRTSVMGKREDDEEMDSETCPECGYAHGKSEKRGDGLTKAQKVAALEEKIGYLKGELALLKDEEEEDDEEMDASEEDEEDEEY